MAGGLDPDLDNNAFHNREVQQRIQKGTDEMAGIEERSAGLAKPRLTSRIFGKTCRGKFIVPASSLLHHFPKPKSHRFQHDTLPMGQKRQREEDTMEGADSQPQSPFLPMFETFRAELDEHHDRRERCIKASRDITASSKKM